MIFGQPISGKDKTPKTIFSKSPKHIKFLINKIGGLPAIAKGTKGSLGLNVMILKDVEQTNSTMEALYYNQIETILQAFVDGKAKDIRAIVVGDEVVASMERTGKKGEFRANVSRGGTGQKIELSDTDKELCIKAAKAINLDVCGVDLIKDAEGNSYILEINAAFGMQIQTITGIDVAGKIIEYIEKNHKQKTTGTGANANGASAASEAPKEDKRTFWEVLSSLRAEKVL